MNNLNRYGVPVGELIQNYRGFILRKAYGMLCDPDAAEDVYQSVCLKLHSNAGRFDGSNIEAWIHRVTVNATIDVIRVRSRSPLAGAGSIDALGTDAYVRNPEELYVRHLDTLKFLGMLSPRKRHMLSLRYQGFTYDEISETLGTTENAARLAIRRLQAQARNFMHHGILPNDDKNNGRGEYPVDIEDLL